MANEQVSEQEIQFRKRARRRLVGAIALVLLLVTVLPMILDDRQDLAPQPEIAINIPSKEGEFVPKVVPVQPAPPAEVSQPDVQTGTQPDPSAPPQPPSPSVAENISAPVAPAADAAAKQNDTSVAASQEVGAAAKPAMPEKPSKASFSVQIGVFSDEANVKQLQEKLAAGGFKYHTEKLDTATGTKIRLRAGPFATRPDAEKALDALKSIGIPGMVVAG